MNRPRKRSSARSTSGESEAPPVRAADLQAWFAGRLPDEWFSEPPTVDVDREEILVLCELPAPRLAGEGEDTGEGDDAPHEFAVACDARIGGFREDTREQRMRVADEAQHRFGRVVSWGAECGDSRQLFTVANVPVMTRLRLHDRKLLDTLIDSGVARSRSEALAWCVRLVSKNEAEWVAKLRDAMTAVEDVRDEGPASA